MALATLSIDLEARLAGLERDMGRAVSAIDKSASKMQRSFSRVDSAVAAIGPKLLAAFGGAAVLSGIQSIVAGLDSLKDAADITGSSVEKLSGLEDVAVRTGGSLETVQTALVKLNQTLNAADGKNSQSQALKAIGLEAEALKRLDPADALLQISVALGRFADDGTKARVVQELFGKSIREVGPLLKDLAEQGSINAKVTTAQAEAAERFSNSIASLGKSFLDLARTVAGPAVDALNAFFQRLQNINAVNPNSLLLPFAGIGASAQDLNKDLTETVAKIVEIRRQIEFAERQGGLAAITLSADKNKLKALEEREAFLRLQQRDLGGRGSQGRGLNLTLPKLPEPKAGGGTSAARVARDSEFDKYLENLRKAIQGTQDLSAVETLRADIAAGKLGKINNAQILYLQNLAVELDALKGKDPLGDFVKTLESGQAQKNLDEINALLAATPTARREELARIEANLVELFQKLNISATQQAEVLDILQEKFKDLSKPIEQATDKVSTFAEEASRNIQDQLGDSLLRILEGDFKSIGRAWLDMLNKMVAQAAAAKLNEFLFGEGGIFGGLFGGGGKGVGDIFGSIFGAIGSGGSGGAKASGFSTKSNGGASSKTSSVYNYNVAAGVTRSEVVAALQQVRDQSRVETQLALRRAGVA
jgi:hypothetical protein